MRCHSLMRPTVLHQPIAQAEETATMVQGYTHPDFVRVTDTFARQLPADRPGGAALTVYHRGQIVVDIWGGTRNKQGTPWTADTLALSFSTTKGIASTLLHILADRGAIAYDERVAHYWPEFGQNGKAQITVRQLLTHEAGLYHLRDMIDDCAEMNDWDHMLGIMERAAPLHTPGRSNGYHGLTYGWLIGGVLEKATGLRFGELLRRELAEPLHLDGCFIGLPEQELHRAARLIRRDPKPRPTGPRPERKPRTPSLQERLIANSLALTGFDNETTKLALLPKGLAFYDWNSDEVLQACNPSAGGMFNSRSLARIYQMLANRGQLDGRNYISTNTWNALSTLQTSERGAVIPIPMRWRLGYHRVFTTGPRTPNAFGHFGFGGSGAWCDPSRELAVGYVVNTGSGSPFGDLRLWQLNSAIIRSAENREGLLDRLSSLLARA